MHFKSAFPACSTIAMQLTHDTLFYIFNQTIMNAVSLELWSHVRDARSLITEASIEDNKLCG